ncbi:facilitated trehalose transporter Tret1-like [Cylas formicarius]|uniref:facilitated trehalose transporter Tret1-like n=1 Tax=Cylas formicarius TaxID=197179 RepID=UPI002958A8B0|nr:facilitated trehalose transporter Tret1-like [Cylas formicarius]
MDTITKNVRCVEYLAVFSSLINVLVAGMQDGWSSAALPKLLSDTSTVAITNDQGSWLAMANVLGAPIGCLSGGYLIDLMGRQTIILAASAPFIASWLTISFGANFAVLCVGRVLGGLAEGWVFTAAPTYICEICDAKIRGFFGMSLTVCYNLGILLSNVTGSYLSVQMAALVNSAFPILAFIAFVWFPESPYYYIMRNRNQEARRSLSRLKSEDQIAEALRRIGNAVKDHRENSGKMKELFTVKNNRRASVMTMMVRFIQQLGGIGPVTSYAQIIFRETGSQVSAEIYSIIFFSIQLTVTMITAPIIDRVGRRPLLLISTAGASLCACALGVYFGLQYYRIWDLRNWFFVPVVALMGYSVIVELGLHPIPMFAVAEYFPANVRGLAVGMGDVYYCVFWALGTKMFQATKEACGIHVPFLVFSLVLAFGVFYMWKHVPETNEKTLEEIQEDLNQK